MERDGRSGREKRPCAVSPAPPTPPAGPKIIEGEEEEVEKFYVLLEHIKAVRDLIRGNDTSKRQKVEAAPATSTQLWRPTFEMADFRDDGDGREGSVVVGVGGAGMAEESAGSALGPPEQEEEGEEDEGGIDRIKRQEEEEEDDDDFVDLGLSL